MKTERKLRMDPYIQTVLLGAVCGSLIALSAWLQLWTSLRLPRWIYSALFVLGVIGVVAFGFFLRRTHTWISRAWIALAVLEAVGLVYLFPDALAPGCGGMPRVFAHWVQSCKTVCGPVHCTWWLPLSDPRCAGKPHNPWDVGCCMRYGQDCNTVCKNVWVDDPPTVKGSISCGTPGHGGWCRGGASLSLSASDPQGYATTISGDINGTGFSCPGPTCTRGLPEGIGAAHFHATSATSNLSSATGTLNFQVDTHLPTLTFDIPSPNGSNGWNRSPVTVSASGTDDTSGVASVSINGGASTLTVSSDGIHALTAVATDNAGNTATASGTVKMDHTAPVFSPTLSGTAGSAGWYRSAVTVASGAADATSGLADVSYVVDGGAAAPGKSVSVSGDGSHTVSFQATDRAGNSSASGTVSFREDTVPPSLSLDIPSPNGSNGWDSSPVTVSASATDATSGVASVSINGGGRSLTISSDGTHTITAVARDNAGNTSTSSGTVKMDRTPPVFAPSLSGTLGAGGWYTSSVTVGAGAKDATSGLATVQVSLDGGTPYSGNSVSVSGDGTHTVFFDAQDVAGNSPTSGILTVRVDTTPPVLTVHSPPVNGEGGWYRSSPQVVTASATDATSGLARLESSLDGGTWQEASIGDVAAQGTGTASASLSPQATGSSTVPLAPLASVTVSGDQDHTLAFRAVDAAGLMTTTSVNIRIDTIPPTLGVSVPSLNGLNGWYDTHIRVAPDCWDATSGIASQEISLDGQNWTGILTLPDGIYDLHVRAVDHAGNPASAVLRTVKVDATPPVNALITPRPTGLNGWYSTLPITIKPAGSDATSGLASPALSLDGSRWNPALYLSADGVYTIHMRSQDKAGNIATTLSLIHVDTTPPLSWFVTPSEGKSTDARGLLTLVGETYDATSGPASAVISLDCGLFCTRTWLNLPLEPSGAWVYPWDTTQTYNGRHVILVRARDIAGNEEHTAQVVVNVRNPFKIVMNRFQPVYFWPALALGALMAVLSAVVVSDQRPRALRELGATMDRIMEERTELHFPDDED